MLFSRTDGTECKSCGAHFSAPAREKSYGLCRICRQKFLSWTRTRDVLDNEIELNNWLAKRLFLEAQRLKKTGVSGRCEAITAGGGALYLKGLGRQGGYQCAGAAIMMRNGHKVCHSHGKIAFGVQFISTPKDETYRDFKRLIAEICLTDDLFLEYVKEAIEGAEAIRAAKTKRRISR